jgi:hypothetical protein
MGRACSGPWAYQKRAHAQPALLPCCAACAQEYASEAKLRELVQRYSEFINFPIYLQVTRNVMLF